MSETDRIVYNHPLNFPSSIISKKKVRSSHDVEYSESFLDLLQSTALAYLATIGPQGEPQVSAVWFTWDGSHLLFALNKKRQKYRNLVREPRVAIAIADPTNSYRALEIGGTVARIEADLTFRYINAATQKYLHRDATPEETGAADERVVIIFELERVFPFPPQSDHKAP